MEGMLDFLAGVGNSGYVLTLSNQTYYIFVIVREREITMNLEDILTTQHPLSILECYLMNLFDPKMIQKTSLNPVDVHKEALFVIYIQTSRYDSTCTKRFSQRSCANYRLLWWSVGVHKTLQH